MTRKNILLVFIILSIFTLQAQSKRKISENLPLHNTKWILDEAFGELVVHHSDTAYIIFYDNYTFSGNLGCNTFFGNYTYGKKRINLDYTGASKRLCADMSVEQQFFKIIKHDVTHYYIEKNNLYLLYKLNVICRFKGIESKPSVKNQQE